MPHLYYQEHYYQRMEARCPAEEFGKSVKLSQRAVYPRTCWGFFRLGRTLLAPFKKLIIAINSVRTYCLCLSTGFRGSKKRKRAKLH